MTLITGMAIDEANEMELADGGLFGQTLFGRQVIDAARDLLRQHTVDAPAPLPLGEFFERREDMGAGRLRLILDGDSDVSVAILSDGAEMADVEFCVPFTGGGRSPKVRDALLRLARAIRDENESNPLELAVGAMTPFGLINESYAVASRTGDTKPWSDQPWDLLPGTLMSDQEAAQSHVQALASSGDSDTQYSAVVIGRAGVKPVGEILWGTHEL
ncbi:hypothetical protein ACI77O_12615 [Pseudomonas tritici]|uniref:hypothetical protein n=1 Tax=Pseudomonas tritici TaxID=2745518 RepID=UPI00387AD828